MVRRAWVPFRAGRGLPGAIAWIGAGAVAVVTSGSTALSPSPGTAANAAIERGRYLTHDVAMCVQCHSPRDAGGEIIRSQEFRGAPIPVPAPPFPRIPWASRAPNIRGVDAYPEAALVQLLREGLTKNGTPPDRPMPPFRMDREDAEAIVAYLRSLD